MHSYIRRDYNVVVAIFFIGFMLVATYSLVLAFKRLVRKGVSTSARASFFGKHLSYVVVILLTWQILLLNNYASLFTFLNFDVIKDNPFYNTTPKGHVSYIFMFGNGVFLTIVRLRDPIYRFIVKQGFYENFGIVLKEQIEGIESKPLNSYLAESLNLELINIILQGILKFANPDYKTIIK